MTPDPTLGPDSEHTMTTLDQVRRELTACAAAKTALTQAMAARVAEVATRAVAAGCTVTEVAELLGVSRPTVYAYLRGQPQTTERGNHEH